MRKYVCAFADKGNISRMTTPAKPIKPTCFASSLTIYVSRMDRRVDRVALYFLYPSSSLRSNDT